MNPSIPEAERGPNQLVGTGPARRLGRALVAVLAAATATSWLQWAVVTARREVFGIFSWKWWLRDQVFLSAAGYLLLLGVLAAGPILVHLLWPRRYTFAALCATLAGMGAFCILMVFERISWLAWLAVAVGLGVQAHRLLQRWPEGGWRWVWRVAILGNLASLVTVAGVSWARQAAEADALRSLPPARPDAMNVLLIIMDTERAQSMSLYGAPEETTPHQTERAHQGVIFDAAYSTASWTLPSHASMFTGHYPSQTTGDWLAPLDTKDPTLAEAFRDHGYATGGFVANVSYTGYRTGLSRGFIRYKDSMRSFRQILLSTTVMQGGSLVKALTTWDQTHWITGTLRTLWPLDLRQPGVSVRPDLKSADEVTAEFLGWLPTRQGRPFFAFLNLFDAHFPYLPPPRYRAMFDSKASRYGRYLGGIRYMDDAVDALLRELERQGLLQSTIVLISADHGEQFGEHREEGHGNGLYGLELRVPLLVLNAPGAVAGTRVRQSVSLRDLPATLLDLAEIPNRAGLGGTSLRPLLAGAAAQPTASPVLAELSQRFDARTGKENRPELRSLVDDSSHIIEAANGNLKLFAYPADLAELNPLMDSAQRTAAAGRLRRIMEQQGITWKGRPPISPASTAPGTTPPSPGVRPRN